MDAPCCSRDGAAVGCAYRKAQLAKERQMDSKIDSRQNIRTRFEGTKLVIEIETDSDLVQFAPSGSGKSMVIASSGGAITLEDGSLLNFTLYRKR